MSERYKSLLDSMDHLHRLVAKALPPTHPVAVAFREAWALEDFDLPSKEAMVKLEQAFASLPESERRTVLNGWRWYPSKMYRQDLEDPFETGVGRSLKLTPIVAHDALYAEHYCRPGAWDKAIVAYIREGTTKAEALDGLRLMVRQLEANWGEITDHEELCGEKCFSDERTAAMHAMLATMAEEEAEKKGLATAAT
jgi:hypothetical protein